MRGPTLQLQLLLLPQNRRRGRSAGRDRPIPAQQHPGSRSNGVEFSTLEPQASRERPRTDSTEKREYFFDSGYIFMTLLLGNSKEAGRKELFIYDGERIVRGVQRL